MLPLASHTFPTCTWLFTALDINLHYLYTSAKQSKAKLQYQSMAMPRNANAMYSIFLAVVFFFGSKVQNDPKIMDELKSVKKLRLTLRLTWESSHRPLCFCLARVWVSQLAVWTQIQVRVSLTEASIVRSVSSPWREWAIIILRPPEAGSVSRVPGLSSVVSVSPPGSHHPVPAPGPASDVCPGLSTSNLLRWRRVEIKYSHEKTTFSAGITFH